MHRAGYDEHGLDRDAGRTGDFAGDPGRNVGQLLDKLRIDAVDLVANDSGGLTAQLFLAKYPARVRSLLLTNCDVDENSPPPQFLPFIDKARQGRWWMISSSHRRMTRRERAPPRA